MNIILFSPLLPERKLPGIPWDDEPEPDIPFIPEDPGDVPVDPEEGPDEENNNRIGVAR